MKDYQIGDFFFTLHITVPCVKPLIWSETEGEHENKVICTTVKWTIEQRRHQDT